MFPPSAIVAPNSAIINTTSYPTQRPNILPGTCLLVSGERLQMLNVGANKISKGCPGWKGDARTSMPRPPTWHLFLQCYLYYVLSSSHVLMWELDHKAGWVLKNWCFWIVVLEKTLESPLDCKEIKPVNPRGNQHYEYEYSYLLEGLMLKLKLQYFGHLMRRADSLEKTLMLGKIEGKRRRGRQRMR